MHNFSSFLYVNLSFIFLYYVHYCCTLVFTWFSLLRIYWVFSHRSTHCIHCFSCQRGNNCRCIRPQGSFFPENLPCLNLSWIFLHWVLHRVLEYCISCIYGITTRKAKHSHQYLCWRQGALFGLCIFIHMRRHIFLLLRWMNWYVNYCLSTHTIQIVKFGFLVNMVVLMHRSMILTLQIPQWQRQHPLVI